MSSDLAIKIYALVKTNKIKTNAQFWREFSKEKIQEFDIDIINFKKQLKTMDVSVVCVFDEEFPKQNLNLKMSEKPFLFLYKGNIDLLNQITNNVAVIGALSPTQDIATREQTVIKKLIKNNYNIVSGLAKGCDTIAHENCLKFGGKTIAILPSTFENIYPKENVKLIDKIISANGLILTEYMREPLNRYERIKRFIERDRLQAMLSNVVILIASYTQGNGDSGSRHAMQKAQEYGKARYVMFNKELDYNNPIFALNKELSENNVPILDNKNIKEL